MRKFLFAAALLLSILSSRAQLFYTYKEYRAYYITQSGDSIVGKLELQEVNVNLDSVLTMSLQDGKARFTDGNKKWYRLKPDTNSEAGFWSQGRLRKFISITLYKNDDEEKKYEYKFLSVFKTGRLKMLGYVYQQRYMNGGEVGEKDYYTEHIILNTRSRVTLTPKYGWKKEKLLKLVAGCPEAEKFVNETEMTKWKLYDLVDFYNENCK